MYSRKVTLFLLQRGNILIGLEISVFIIIIITFLIRRPNLKQQSMRFSFQCVSFFLFPDFMFLLTEKSLLSLMIFHISTSKILRATMYRFNVFLPFVSSSIWVNVQLLIDRPKNDCQKDEKKKNKSTVPCRDIERSQYLIQLRYLFFRGRCFVGLKKKEKKELWKTDPVLLS